MLFRLICHFRGIILSVAMYMKLSVCWIFVRLSKQSDLSSYPTSTVSSTFITPGWRNVRSFLTAFRASGRRDLLALISKENMLQFDPSSYSLLSKVLHGIIINVVSYPFLAILQHPYPPLYVLAISERIWKIRDARGYCRRDNAFEKIHYV